MKRISVDIGGTFTDCLVAWDGTYVQAKALTTHHNLSSGFNEALDHACSTLQLDRKTVLSGVDSVRYATTLGTNALIERKGPAVGALVTAGFDATIPLSRGRGYGEGLDELGRNDLSSGTRPDPIVPQRLIRSVRERVDYAGNVVLDLDEDDVRRALRGLVDAGAQAVVVSFTNAVENPVHERRVQQIFLEEYPAHQLGSIPMLLSHQMSGRKGEYVRTTSTIIAAYLHSTMYFALSDLEQNLREHGYTRPMLVNHNSGGMAQLNSTDALQTIHSGPVAGIAASEHLGQQTGIGNVVATDMGGTSFDIGLVPGDGVKHYDFMPVIDRWLVTVPMVHLVTLGAGGGSIARYDTLHKSIAVGPESAGSSPGPACYDRGGSRPTVTDADVVLGYIDPVGYAGGNIPLNVKRARFALDEEFGDHLDLEIEEIAALITSEVDEQMASGMAKELRLRGYQPQEFTMLAYGGNGPLHACGIAGHLGIDRVLVPPYSSVFSALGAGNTSQLHIHERTVPITLFDATTRVLFTDFDAFNGVVEELEEKGRNDLVRQGLDRDAIQHRLELDMRYGNQLVTMAVTSDISRMTSIGDCLHLAELFAGDYARRYGAGSQSPEAGIRVTTVRVASYVPTETITFDARRPSGELVSPAPVGTRTCRFPGVEGPVEVSVYDEAALQPSAVLHGPAVVTVPTTTYLVQPGWRLEVGGHGAIWFLRDDAAS
ncbi:5-oxoprolinase (ATP-hydrolyzing) [Nostocoides japonicum T1-X7]|uniref:5-oxoprolinase (ATP-hydrolyzing) n=1 Tax=Nostocoides japonicum T1-X7 TaxID=1194083 RepID=A0A077M232_9MICO|nr:hydantoinase/oxoprolinase family protein [Tetrasphaera japonica]CCH78284.1 5-oxoprolinase (ATP-hydrolyzing) [Tetrasphaera japonica T1-X7]